MRRSGLFALLVGSLLVGLSSLPSMSGPSGAQGLSSSDAAVYTAGKTPQPGEPGAARLRAKAASGSVRVFVKLGISLASEDSLDPAAAARQTQDLALAQSGFVARTVRAAQARHRVRNFRYIPYVAMTVNAGELESVLGDAAVDWVGEVGARRAIASSTPYNIDKIKVEDLWKDGHDGKGFAVAVLDAGMQASHPIFGSRVVEEMCYSTTDAANNKKTLCPNGQDKMTGDGASKNCPVSYGSVCKHGTHVAGIATGEAWNGLLGVARGADVILGQVFTEITTPSAPSIVAFDDDVVLGLERIYSLRNTYKIASVNLSLGGGKYSSACDSTAAPYVDIFLRLREAKIAPVVAAGNDGSNGLIASPACASSAIAVGATDQSDELASFSNFSQLVKVLAPGVAIKSAAPGNGEATLSGTSQAAPHVAGAFAVLRDVEPAASVAEILRALECTGEKVEVAGIRKRRIDLEMAERVLLSPENKPKAFTFDTAADGKAWTPIGGSTWAVRGGAYVPTMVGGADVISITPNCNSDLEVSIDFGKSSGPFSISVMVKLQVDKRGKYISAYRFTVSNSFYAPLKKYSISRSVMRYDEHNQAGTVGGIAYLYSECGSLETKPSRSMDVKVRGAMMTMSVDSATVTTIKDPTYTTGAVGLAASGATGAGGVKFDSVTITPRDKSPGKPDEDADVIAAAPAPSLNPGDVRPQC